MKKNLIQKAIASFVAVASVCSCFTMGAMAKISDGTITIVDAGKVENIATAITGEKLQATNFVKWIWEGAKSGDCYYEVKTGTDTDYSLGVEGGDLTTYPILKATLGENFWTEENKDKYIVITVSTPAGGYDYLSLVGKDNKDLTSTAQVVTWNLAGYDASKFNTTYIVYKPSEARWVDEHLEGAHYSVYQNGVKTDFTNGTWIDGYNQYPTEIGLKFGSWGAGAKIIYMNRFGVYVTDDPESLMADYNLISDNTGYNNVWVPAEGAKATEAGYLGKAADDVSTHTTTPYFANEYDCEVRQTLTMHDQDDNGDGTADWYTDQAGRRYLVFGAQMASKQFTYVGLRADYEWFTPALAMWDYCLTDQWNQIYIVYDRESEGATGGARGKTYFYINGNMVLDGAQRGGSWDKLAKRMNKISLYASNYHSGAATDVHWDNVEMYTTDVLPDFTETMPALTATDACAITNWNVSLKGEVTPADLAFDGDKVRVYKGGDVNAPLAADEVISAWDTISVDKGNQVRKYTVVSVEAPAVQGPVISVNEVNMQDYAGKAWDIEIANFDNAMEYTATFTDGEDSKIGNIGFENVEADGGSIAFAIFLHTSRANVALNVAAQ